jgi:hypothetical protein
MLTGKQTAPSHGKLQLVCFYKQKTFGIIVKKTRIKSCFIVFFKQSAILKNKEKQSNTLFFIENKIVGVYNYFIGADNQTACIIRNCYDMEQQNLLCGVI